MSSRVVAIKGIESMTEYSLGDTLRTLASKLDDVQGVLNGSARMPSQIPSWSGYGSLNTTVPNIGQPSTAVVLHRLDTLSAQVEELRRNVAILRNQQPLSPPVSILPVHPMHGIEVVPKREVVIGDDHSHSLSVADRLLLNKNAKKALEAEEMGASHDDEYPLEEEEEEQEEEEAEVEEEEEAEEEEELTAFDYKGGTFYRDSSNNVFMTDEDGDLIEEPIGSWNQEKNRIVMKA